MGLYESLDEAVGACLLACAPAIGCPIPPRAILLGGKFSAFLRARGEAEAAGNVLDAMAREIWLSQDTRGISLTAAEEHALLLPKILKACRPDPQEIAAALNSGRLQGGTASARISSDVVGRGIGAGVLAATGRPAEICQFLLEKTLDLLLVDPGLLQALRGAFQAFAAAAAPVQPVAKPAPAPAPADPAEAALPARAADAAHHEAATAVASGMSEPRPAGEPAPASGNGHDIAVPLDGMRRRHGLSEAAMGRLADLLDKRQVPPAQRLARLEELSTWIASARDHLLQPSNDPADIRRLNEAAADALASADFIAAERHLSAIRQLARDSRRALEKRLRDELTTLQSQQRDEAEAIAGLAELALARHDFDAALALFQEAAETLPPNDRDGALRFMLWRADTLLRKGRQLGEGSALTQAAQAYAEALQLARTLSSTHSAALADVGIGRVLILQAERSQDAALLDEAIAALQRALARLSQSGDKVVRSEAQTYLADALSMLGGPRLSEAAVGYENALAALSREEAPLRWALTQVKLGGTLVRMAEAGQDRRLWVGAAQAMFAALDVFDAEGAEEHAELARRSLRRFHDRLPAALAPREAEA